MPNRILKESIRTSKKINEATDFQFRLWAYLVTYVDDFGRGSADPELIKGFVFPRRKNVTESTIEKSLADLAAIGLIHLYEIGGESYLCFPNWGDHQRIQNKKSRFPGPENENSPSFTVSHGESPPESESKYKKEKEIDKEKEKKPYGEFGKVMLTEDEELRLVQRLGKDKARDYIDRLDGYLAAKGKSYKSHYATVLNWWRKDEKAKGGDAKWI